MKAFIEFMFQGLVKFASTKAVSAIRDGFVATMPATLIGSLFLLMASLPFNGYSDFMSNLLGADWDIGLNQVSTNTFDILSLLAAVSIAYAYAKNEKQDGISCAMLSLMSFLIISDSTVLTASGEIVGGVIPRGWTGANGVIAAIFASIVTAKIFVFCNEKELKVKMPEGVPEGVTNAFSALIPGFFIILFSMLVYQICMVVNGTSLTEIIFKVLQIPLQNVSSTWLGGVIIVTLISLLFWAGIHGANIVIGVIGPILTANALANQALIEAGTNTVAEGSKILTIQFVECFTKFGGTGITVGLLIASLMAAKSKQMKEISKISMVPAVFNINEPVIFGLPIVYNPLMLAPFVLVPLAAFIITYTAILTGFMAPFGSVTVPWTTPVVISGFLLGGWQGAVVQIAILIASVVIYYPFVLKQDALCLKDELGVETEE